jgi:hypothetical protein
VKAPKEVDVSCAIRTVVKHGDIFNMHNRRLNSFSWLTSFLLGTLPR